MAHLRIASRRSHGRESGMSLIEVVIAAAVLLMVSVGTLPMFVRSAFNTIYGLDSTQASQHAISGHESLLVLAVDDRRLELSDPLPEHTVRPTADGTGVSAIRFSRSDR